MKRRGPVRALLFALALLTGHSLWCQTVPQTGHFLRLKSRSIATDGVSASSSIASAGRVHLIAQTDGGALDRDALGARGVIVLGYIPDNGVSISADADSDFTGLGFRWIGALAAADRQGFPAANAVDADTPGYFVAEFYSDVNMDDARAAVFGEQIAVQQNPDLLPAQLLIFGTRAQMVALSYHDIVVYIFPAADELAQGLPVTACVSAETNYGSTMAMASNLISGWSENNQGVAALLYSFGPMTGRIPSDTIRTLFQQAQRQWATYAKITFTETTSRNASRNIDLGFYSGDHGDAFPFDGPGGVLAHTFYPVPTNSEPIAGDMHMDADELWTTIGSGTDFYSVALHELGHALGLVHTASPLDVMYPFYRHNTTFSPTDIAAIQSLYQAADGSPAGPPGPIPLGLIVQAPPAQVATGTISLAGTTNGGTGAVQVSWTTDRGALGVAQGSTAWTVAAVPLAVGTNTISVAAKDDSGTIATQSVVVVRVDTTPPPPPPPATTPQPPSIQITSPSGGTLSTTSFTTDIRGTATHPVGIRSITWKASTGASGTAQGTTAWDTGSIGLLMGNNSVIIDAVSLDGGTASATVQITVAAPGGGGGGGGTDTTPPSLSISSPSNTSVSTSAASITITGTAADNVGVQAVHWETAIAGAVATGTTNWSTGPIPLLLGMNNIVVRAYDAAGNMSWRSISVIKQ